MTKQERKLRRQERKKERVPLKDRPGWQKFKAMLPGIAAGIAEIVPGGGVISSIIRGLQNDPDTAPPAVEVAKEFLSPIEVEEAEIDLDDLQAAREVELERLKAPDWFSRNIVGLLAVVWTGFSMFMYTIVLLGKVDMHDNIKLLVINAVGNIAMLIVGYYFGSTDSSQKKTDLIAKKLES